MCGASSVRRKVVGGLRLTLIFVSASRAGAGTYVEGPPLVNVTPTNGFAWISTSGIEIVQGTTRYLYLYMQGGPNAADPCDLPGAPRRTGDAIYSWRAPINAAGQLVAPFQKVGRVSPCVAPPYPASATFAFWGPGQVFKAKVNGSTRYFLLANVGDATRFDEVWLGSSPNGHDWTWEVTTLPVDQEQSESYAAAGEVARDLTARGGKAFIRRGLAGPAKLLEQTPLSAAPLNDNAAWWGFLNFGPTANAVTHMTRFRVLWSGTSPSAVPVVQVMSGLQNGVPNFATLPADASAHAVLDFVPHTLTVAAARSLRYSRNEESHELWAWNNDPSAAPYNGNNVDCPDPPGTANVVTCMQNQPSSSCGGCFTGDGSCVPMGQSGNAFLLNTGAPGAVQGGLGTRFVWWNVSETFMEPFGKAVGSTMRHLRAGYETARQFPFVWTAPNGTHHLFSSTNDANICSQFLFNPFFKTYVTQSTLVWTP